MTPGRWKEVKRIFDAVCEAPPHDRAFVLASLTARDPSLLAEAETLLQAAGAASRFDAPFAGTGFDPLRAAPPNFSGTLLDGYEIAEEIGRGGMSTVYRARLQANPSSPPVAVKIVHHPAHAAAFEDWFQRERRILASLEHPYISRLLASGVTPGGLPYLVMEFVDGLPIDEYSRARRLSVEEQLGLILKVCQALQYAHGRQIVHRDLKPANILVTPAGDPRLLDFGIAKVIESGPAARSTALHFLTPAYASPEQLGRRAAGFASDIYSLGVILFELLTGELPAGPRPLASRALLSTRRTTRSAAVFPEPPLLRRAKLAGPLDALLLRTLHPEPSRRPPSVGDFAAGLESSLRSLPDSTRPAFTRIAVWFAGAAAALALLAAAWRQGALLP